MNQQILNQLFQVVKALTGLVAALAQLALPVAGVSPSQHFGALPPNLAATTTLPAFTGTIPYVQSFDGSVYTLSSSTINFIASSTIGVGGTSTYNSIQSLQVASGTTGAFTLGAVPAILSSFATTTVNIPIGGLTAGDPCFGSLATTSRIVYVAGCSIVLSDNQSSTVSVAFGNLSASTATLAATLGFRVVAFHLPF